MENAQSHSALLLAGLEDLRSHPLDHRSCGCGGLRRQIRANHVVADSSLQGGGVILVDDQICHIEADVGALRTTLDLDWVRPQAVEGLMKLGAIIGEIEHGLPRSRKHRDSFRRCQVVDAMFGGIAHACKVGEIQSQIVENQRRLPARRRLR